VMKVVEDMLGDPELLYPDIIGRGPQAVAVFLIVVERVWQVVAQNLAEAEEMLEAAVLDPGFAKTVISVQAEVRTIGIIP